MPIPLVYNVNSVRERWQSAIVAVLGIGGTVAVFVAMLAMAHGFQATLVSSGSPENAIVRRAGATSEMDSSVTVEEVKILEVAKGVAHNGSTALASPEVVVVASFPLKATGTDANVQVRGLSARVLDVRPSVKLTAGRMFQAGLPELVLGRNVMTTYAGFALGRSIRFGGETWTVVGTFDAGGSAFDSEVWCDSEVLKRVYQRPLGAFQSTTVRLESPEAFPAFKASLAADPRLTLQVEREAEYYEKESRMLTQLITVLGTLVAAVMGLGAVFGALNTMYSAVAERTREIATMRALGFGSLSVVTSFVFESLVIALVGGLVGCVAVLPVNGITTGALNWQTFSHLAFAFRITPVLLGLGIVFALLMGVVGGLPPAVRAARLPIASALRDL